MTRSTATRLSLVALLLAPFIAMAQTVTSTTKTPATVSPGPTMQNPEPHGPSGGMPPGTRGGSGVDSGTEIAPPTTLPKK